MVETTINRAPVPDGWQPFLGYTQHVISARPDNVDQTCLNQVMARINSLSDNQLEALRYFSLSEGCAELTQYLMRGNYLAGLIDGAAEGIAQAHYDTYGSQDHAGLYLSDFSYTPMEPSFISASLEATYDMDLEMLFLMDCLHIAASIRRGMIKRGKVEKYKAQALGLETGARYIGQVAPMSSSELYRRALMETYGFRHRLTNTEVKIENPLIRQIKSEAAIRKFRLRRMARFLASLRGDENVTSEIVESCIERSPQGEYTPNHKALSDVPPPLGTLKFKNPDMKVLHDDRLGCPAMKVKKMFEIILGMMPEIIILADRKIRNEPPQPELDSNVLEHILSAHRPKEVAHSAQ